MELIWQRVKESLAVLIPPHAFRMWIEPLEIEAAADAKVVQLRCPNAFSRKRVLDHFGELILSEFRDASGRAIDLDLVIASGNEDKRPPNEPPRNPNNKLVK